MFTMALPHLFPTGKADPTVRGREIKVDLKEGCAHLLKWSYWEDGLPHYPFQEDNVFSFYACDVINRPANRLKRRRRPDLLPGSTTAR